MNSSKILEISLVGLVAFHAKPVFHKADLAGHRASRTEAAFVDTYAVKTIAQNTKEQFFRSFRAIGVCRASRTDTHTFESRDLH